MTQHLFCEAQRPGSHSKAVSFLEVLFLEDNFLLGCEVLIYILRMITYNADHQPRAEHWRK
jgi:hypothetical protein